MKIPIYYLDAFTQDLFSGNPAAVIFSDIDDSNLMQKIAAENNLSETAFIKNKITSLQSDGLHLAVK